MKSDFLFSNIKKILKSWRIMSSNYKVFKSPITLWIIHCGLNYLMYVKERVIFRVNFIQIPNFIAYSFFTFPETMAPFGMLITNTFAVKSRPTSFCINLNFFISLLSWNLCTAWPSCSFYPINFMWNIIKRFNDFIIRNLN